MDRNVNKTIEDFEKLQAKNGGSFGEFYASEIYSLWNISADGSGVDVYKLTINALRFGFMLGFKAAENKKTAGKRAKIPTA